MPPISEEEEEEEEEHTATAKTMSTSLMHTIHIASLAYNSVFVGEFMLVDWDMFHSPQPAGRPADQGEAEARAERLVQAIGHISPCFPSVLALGTYFDHHAHWDRGPHEQRQNSAFFPTTKSPFLTESQRALADLSMRAHARTHAAPSVRPRRAKRHDGTCAHCCLPLHDTAPRAAQQRFVPSSGSAASQVGRWYYARTLRGLLSFQ
ncbi:hypothetical protein HU200_035590 [Digitaria exilis]|uniref:Uncharacterized protein n=1 Tax=Digitaria exilis TaxID=1010633 RepID=A0A835BIS4_9POAL|nr:hypothetical protein HU200_035590 [Digitaria exilis]